MNIWKGLNHRIRFRTPEQHQAIAAQELKRPPGMSARQWKIYNKNARREAKAKGAATVTVVK
jgi:hypothetical protein